MSSVYISDIFKIFHNFETSRLKMWEIVRTYNPIEFAQFLYLLENVTKSSKRKCVDLDDRRLQEFCDYSTDNNDIDYYDDNDDDDYIDDTNNDPLNNPTIKLSHNPTLRLERVTVNNGVIFWNQINTNDSIIITTTTTVNTNSNVNKIDYSNNVKPFKRHPLDLQILTVMESIRNGIAVNKSNVYEQIIQHNLGSFEYGEFLNKLQHSLFMDSLQLDRNEYVGATIINRQSIVTKFLQFYIAITGKQIHDSDPRGFRFLITPQPKRILNIDDIKKSEYIVQPLYQGFHVVVYSSPTETKCYNRFGELHLNLAYNMRTQINCTFEAIILPIDRHNTIRSWRYWPYKKRYIFYIVDVYRFEQNVLINVPFVERLKYIETIVASNRDVLKSAKLKENRIELSTIPNHLKTWSIIEETYIKNRDIFDPIVGVLLRKPTDKLQQAPLEFKFDIRYCFDLLATEIIDLPNVEKLKSLNIQRMHINYEMADYRTTCIAYGHCDKYIYLCEYNRTLHQFVHFARLERSPYEMDNLTYKSEQIYVIDNRTMPRGIIYLRVYYDYACNILGYDTKLTDCRYNVPYHNDLYEKLKTKKLL